MSDRIEAIFPAVEAIEDDGLREAVIASWELVRSEGPGEPIESVRWSPPRGDVGDQPLADHVRGVTAIAADVVAAIERHVGQVVDLDDVIAGALVHDVSKPFEHLGDAGTEVREYLGHPHFAIYVLERAGVPTRIQHVALAHTPRSGVEPRTMAAAVVRHADELDMAARYVEGTGDLPP